MAGCGGGGEEEVTIDTSFLISALPGGTGAFGSYYMASITTNWRDAAASFRSGSVRFRLQDGTFTVNGVDVFANPLQSSRVDYAHALGLTGAGEVIAVVDSGFLTTHEVFAGKTNTTTGAPGVTNHGTMVASIAAGDSASMVGVAPGADLIFSDWGFANLAAAANAATARGAVAQNNSWAFVNTFADSAGYNSIFGNAAGQTWLTALQTYAANGVVIFAISNDELATTSSLMEALPLFQPGLQSAWLAVGNTIPIFDDNGVSGVAERLSSGCLQSAAWCLMADGSWIGANGSGGYQSSTGSSFAAPQVAGALALLAEAFPALTPHQLRARILASADNTFTGFASAGTIDLLEGTEVFNHAYSTEFGHGFLDIRAALLPIGPTVLAQADGSQVATADFGFASGGAMGDAITRGLDGIDLAVSDAFGGGFEVAAKSFAVETAPEALAATLQARSLSRDFKARRTGPANPLADTFAAHPGRTLDIATDDGRMQAAVLIGGEDSYGLAVSQTLTEGDLKLDLGLKVARDGGAVMGFSDAGGAGGATMTALTLALSNDSGDGGFFALSGEIGVADLAAPTAMTAVSAATFNSARLDLGSRGVFAKGDRLAVGVSMPVSVTSGSASMAVPVALGEGRSEIRALDVGLAPEARQMDLSISYQVPMSESSELLFEVVQADNYGNRAGFTDSAAVIGMKWSF